METSEKMLENRAKFIGQKIKEARENAGLSQKELAEKVGFESGTAISLIEAGERKLRVEDLEKIAGVLQRDISFFLGQEKKQPDIRHALRADKDLSPKDKETILHFIDLAKKRKHGD